MVNGLDVFARFFAEDTSRYVLIGGVATFLVLEDAGLAARATKDLDIVLCVEALDADFGAKLWRFINLGGYEIRQIGDAGRCFYRFAKPRNPTFPAMLEFFAREPGYLPLAAGAHLTPVPFEQAVQSLSAILLDTDYYAFLHAHTVHLVGVNVVTEKALIPLKARAWLDLSARKAAGGDVDSKHLSKHRNDVLRLLPLLATEDRIPAPPSIQADIVQFVLAVQTQVTPELLRQFRIAEAPVILLTRLRTCFGVATP